MTNGGRQQVIRWTLEGVYMLGFFIKSPKAKEYRKQVARLLKEQSEAKFTRYTDEITNLKAVMISKSKHNQNVINGYKSQISQKNITISCLKKHYEIEKAQNNKQGSLIDFDGLNQLLQFAIGNVINKAQKEIYGICTELTLKFDKSQNHKELKSKILSKFK